MSYPSIFTAADNTVAQWGWLPNVPSTALETVESRSRIIGRVHNLWQNDAISRAIINRISENTVGTGPRLQSQPEKEILSINDKELQAWSAKVEAKFRLFWESAQVDLAGFSTGANLCSILLTNVLVHGDSGIRFVRDKASGLKLQVIDGTRFESPTDKYNDPDVIAGVEVDHVTGAPRAYYINIDKPNSLYQTSFKPQRFNRYEKDKLATDLVFIQARPNQYRGLPLLTPVVENLKKLHDLVTAEVRGEQVRSSIGFAIEAIDEETPTKELDGNVVLTQGEQRLSAEEFYAGNKNAANNVPLAHGKVLKLRKGDKLHTLQNPDSAGVLKDLSNLLTMTMGACAGVPNEILLQVYNTSYTAARAAKLDFDTKIRILRKHLYNWLCSRVYEYWLGIEIASGRIEAPGFFLEPEIRNAWLAHEFTGDSAGHIDPVKMANFFIPLVNAGLCSFERAMSELWGIDFTTEIARIASEREVLKTLRLDDLIAAGTASQASQAPNQQNAQGAKEKRDDKEDSGGADKDKEGDDDA